MGKTIGFSYKENKNKTFTEYEERLNMSPMVYIYMTKVYDENIETRVGLTLKIRL